MTAGTSSVSVPPVASTAATLEDTHEELYEELRDSGLLNTDLGLAYLFARLYSPLVRYCAAEDCWYVWAEHRWIRDRTRAAEWLLQGMLRDMMALDPEVCSRTPRGLGEGSRRRRDEASEEDEEQSPRSRLASWAWRSGRAGTVRGVLMLAQADTDLAVEPEDFDLDRALVGVENGVLELSKSGVRHRVATQDDMLTMSTGVAWAPKAKCPKFERFIAEIMGGDAELIGWMQRALGSCLSGLAARDQVLPVLQGDGANGKSTLMSLISYVLGDYAVQADPKLITLQRERGVPLGEHRIRLARLVNIVEPSQEVDLDEGRIKQFTGGEPVVHRGHYQAEQTSIPGYKIILQTNPIPRVSGSDHGIWRRVLVVPFRRRFDGAERNPRLLTELKQEAPGVLRWLADGFRAWVRDGLGTCSAIVEASKSVRAEADTIGSFVASGCRADPTGEAPARALYAAYEVWCRSAGVRPVTETAFGRALTAMGHVSRDTRTGRVRLGLVLTLEE